MAAVAAIDSDIMTIATDAEAPPEKSMR